MQHATTTRMLPKVSGNLGVLTLNNVKAAHALTYDMLLSATEILQNWLQNKEIHAIVWQSSSSSTFPSQHEGSNGGGGGGGGNQAVKGKEGQGPPAPQQGRPRPAAFCAGGDIKSLALDCRDNDTHRAWQGQGVDGVLTSDFFRHEYYLNHVLSLQRKVQISIWDGIVFGGGVGISIFGHYRIATERSLWAMPETAIGMFPDVGCMWALPRILSQHHHAQQHKQHQQGILPFLLLTGHRLHPDDLLYTGLATHYVPSQELPQLQAALIEATTATTTSDPSTSSTPSAAVISDSSNAIASVLESFHRPLPTNVCFLAQHVNELTQVFGNSDITITTDSTATTQAQPPPLSTTITNTAQALQQIVQ